MLTAHEKMMAVLPACCLASSLAGCGAGPYGFGREYVPLREEQALHEQGVEYPYAAVVTGPTEYQGKLVAWFGVVEVMDRAPDGRYLVRLAHRKHQERHLCDGESADSCRVTVQFSSQGGFSALVDFRPADLVPGLDKVQPGTLLRIFGKVRCEENDDEQVECEYDEQGGIVLDASWYRQWPARYYVTTRAAGGMRR
jgi:hypothetical protein